MITVRFPEDELRTQPAISTAEHDDVVGVASSCHNPCTTGGRAGLVGSDLALFDGAGRMGSEDLDVERSLEHPDHLQSYGYAPSLKAKDDRPLTTERRETFPQQTPGLPTVAEPGSRPVARIHPSGRLGTSQAASQRVLGGQLSGRQPVPRDLRNITVAWASPMGNVGPNDGFGSRDPPVEVLQQGRERRVFRHPTITTQVGPACRRSSMS